MGQADQRGRGRGPDPGRLGARRGRAADDGRRGRRRGARLLPFGRHKGWALAVGVEFLAGALASANCLAMVGDMYGEPDAPMRTGHVFVAIDPERLRPDGPSFAAEVTRLQREINALPATAGGERVLWPGQLEAKLAEERRAHGDPLPAAIVESLARLEPVREP